MNNEKPINAKIRSRKLWDKHGSWLILIVVVGIAFNGGVEWNSYKMRGLVTTIVEAGVKERDSLRARLREVHDRNAVLAGQIGPAVIQAETAARKSSEAVEKADETIIKANQLIDSSKN